MNHDWQGPNAGWEQSRETVQGTEKEGQRFSSPARTQPASPERRKRWSDGPDRQPGWQESGKLLQGVLSALGVTSPDLSGLRKQPPWL